MSSGCGVRRYIYFLILPTPLVSALFCSSIPTFVCFSFFMIYISRDKSLLIPRPISAQAIIRSSKLPILFGSWYMCNN